MLLIILITVFSDGRFHVVSVDGNVDGRIDISILTSTSRLIADSYSDGVIVSARHLDTD
jgi:hypothetical protein